MLNFFLSVFLKEFLMKIWILLITHLKLSIVLSKKGEYWQNLRGILAKNGPARRNFGPEHPTGPAQFVKPAIYNPASGQGLATRKNPALCRALVWSTFETLGKPGMRIGRVQGGYPHLGRPNSHPLQGRDCPSRRFLPGPLWNIGTEWNCKELILLFVKPALLI